MIRNAANFPLFDRAGTVPDVSGALTDYYQMLTFILIEKTVSGFQVIETQNPINFRGVIQPLTGRRLDMKPEGQRAWNWLSMQSDTALTLKTDDIVLWNNKPTRVMAEKRYDLYGYVDYELVQDWDEGASV